MKPYPRVDDLLRPILGVAMPRPGRLYAPGGTVHVVARCNNREFSFTTSADFEVLLDRNPVRAGLVDDPATYPWSNCAALRPGIATSPDHVPPQRPGPQPVPEGAPAALPHPALAQSRSPAGCPRSPLDEPARRGERRVPHPLSPPTREAKKCSRASAHSSTWGLKGVRYFFALFLSRSR